MRYIRAVTAVLAAMVLISLTLAAHPAKAASSKARIATVTVPQDRGIVSQAEAVSETATSSARPGLTARASLKISSSNYRRPAPETVARE